MQIYHVICPYCQHQYDDNEAQINKKSGYTRCDNCQKIFTADGHITPITNHASALNSNSNTPNNPLNQNVKKIDKKLLPSELKTNQPIKIKAESNITKSTSSNNPIVQQTSTQHTKSPITQADTLKNKADNIQDAPEELFDDVKGIDDNVTPAIMANADQKTGSSKHPHEPSNTNSQDNRTTDDIILNEFVELPEAVDKPFDLATSVEEEDENDNKEAWLDKLLEDDDNQSNNYLTNNTISNNPNKANLTDNYQSNVITDASAILQPASAEVLEKMQQRFDYIPSTQRQAKAYIKTMTWVWSLGCIFLVLALIAQYFIFNFQYLMAKPETAVKIDQFCTRFSFNCQLPLVDSQQLQAEPLKLSVNKLNPQQTDLIFVIKNQADKQVLLPNLLITLRSGVNTHAQFVVMPEQYNDKGVTMIAPHQLKFIKLRVHYPKQSLEQVNIDLFY